MNDQNQDDQKINDSQAQKSTDDHKTQMPTDNSDDQNSITVQDEKPQNQLEYQPDKVEETAKPVHQPAEPPNPVPEKPDHAGIEVQQYDSPVRRPLATLEETLGEEPHDMGDDSAQERPNDIFPPLKTASVQDSGSGRAVAIITPIIIFMLLAGFGAGFGGYKYLQKQTASADNPTQSTGSTKTIETQPSADQTPSSNTNTSSWSNYTNSKYQYSVKFPDTWYSEGTNDPNSVSTQFTSFKPDAATNTTITDGYKVEIVFQDTNSKTLKDWLDANNASVNAKISSSQSLTLGSKNAIQETLSAPTHSIATYLIQADKVMIISYFGAEKDFATGSKIYEDILNSIKFS